MLPRIGVPFQPGAMARAALGDIRRLRESGWVPQLIDAHYLYPDGVAAAWLAEQLHVPFVMTARGTDVNVLASLPGPGRRIAWAASRASAVITVSQSLRDRLITLGVDAAKIAVLRNGVDMQVFDTADRRAARERLGLAQDGKLLLCVGNLLPEKDQALALQCLKRLPHERLLIVGDGPLRAQLAATARQLGIEARVLFRSAMPQADLRYAYAAADALLLTSTREGWPNVVLEALACGTPVVACDVGAVREIVTEPSAGCVVPGREVQQFTAAIVQVLTTGTSQARVRQHAAQFDWGSISRGQYEVFTRAIARAPT
jgi:glycosyltransferase involved in cell wall biosynthesis